MTILKKLSVALGCLVLSASIVHSQAFPTKDVRIVVAYPAGGAADVIVRSVAQRLNAKWGHSVIVENKAGGATQIAAKTVSESAADGYTMFATGMETFAISPYIRSKLNYDPDKDFIPVSGLGYAHQILAVPADSPLRSIADVISKAKSEQGALQYGTIGMGGSAHINMILFESLAKVKLTPVHYRGGAPMLTDLLGGHVPMGFLSVTLLYPNIKEGRLRALGVGSKTRLPQLPDVPTINESGVSGFEAVSWFGLFAPAGTPRDVVTKVNADLQEIFNNAEFQEKFMAPNFLGSIPGNQQHFSDYIKAEAAKWSKVVKDANIKID